MSTFESGAASILARAVSAEVRARMAAQRVSLRVFAKDAGFQSHNYVAMRNRDQKAYDLDDLELICRYFGVDPWDFINDAIARHGDDILTRAVNMKAVADHSAAIVADPEVDAARKVMRQRKAK